MLGSAGGLIGKKFHFNSYLTKALADAILVEWSIKWREGDSYRRHMLFNMSEHIRIFVQVNCCILYFISLHKYCG